MSAESAAKERIVMTSGSHQYCTFQIGDFFFGVEVTRVQEVVRFQPLTRVPLAPREVSGLINLRGQIITTIDLRRRLRLPDRAGDERPTNLLISTPEGAVSFQVDQIEDVISVDPASVEAPPEMLAAEVRRCLLGVSKQRGRLLLLLDEARAMELVA
jgi:purine-binding chemotaxis protein CheW